MLIVYICLYCLFVFYVVEFNIWYIVLVRFVLIVIEFMVFVLCFEFVTIGN